MSYSPVKTVCPVRAMLRDGETSIAVYKDGRVLCGPEGSEDALVVQGNTESPAFGHFMFFWASTFPENRLSSWQAACL